MMLSLRNYHGSIIDPIHGLIRVSDIEKWFLFQKPFSRLRKIRQNTFLYYVFPAANQSRFEHSIGVMHLASEVFQSTLVNYDSGFFRKQKHDSTGPKGFSFFDIRKSFERHYTKQEDAKRNLDIVFQELRLAALLHDIGHGPLSHHFDNFCSSRIEFLEMIKTSPIGKYHEHFKSFFGDELDSKAEHEEVSCYYILRLVDSLKSEANENPNKFIPEIKEIIDGLSGERIVKLVEPSFGFDQIRIGDLDLTPFLSSIISSFPIDADRMDYLLRDSFYSGVKYGIYDLNRLKMSFMPLNHEGKIYMGFKESGLDSMIRFIESRAHLYNQVYSHRTNQAANTMLNYCCEGIAEHLVPSDNYNTFENFYWENVDEIFLLKTLAEKIPESKKRDYEDFLRRRVWKRIFEVRIWIPNDSEAAETVDRIEDILGRIARKLEGAQPEDFVARSNQFKNAIFKDSGKSQLQIIKKKFDGSYELRHDWNEVTYELGRMDYEVRFIRIFLKRTFKSSEDFQRMRKLVLELVSHEIDNLLTATNNNFDILQ